MSVSWEWVPLLVAAGVVAGFVNTVAGGGSFFSFPLLILLGFPPHIANGTIRVTIVMQNLVGVPTYARQGFFLPRAAAITSIVTVPAAILGSLTAVHLDPEPFRLISAILVLVVLCTLFIKPSHWTRAEALARIRWHFALPAFAAVGFYGGFFQLGAGMPFLAAAVLAGGWDLVSANSLKVTVILIFSTVALGVFAYFGQVDWGAGLTLGVGNMFGAWLGARSAVKRGPGWIRWVMVVMGVLAAARLLLGNGLPSAVEAFTFEEPGRVASRTTNRTSADGESLITAAFHVHGPFSEGNASMEWHTDHARRLGVDVIWWTDHDWRTEGWGHTRRFDFENVTVGPTGTLTEPDEALSENTRSWEVAIPFPDGMDFGISAARAHGGVRSLRLWAGDEPPLPGFRGAMLAQRSSRKRHRRPVAGRPVISMFVYPETFDAANSKFWIDVEMSLHPDSRHRLRWIAGSLEGEDASVVPIPLVPGQWNEVTLDVASAAIARYGGVAGDSLRALDNSMYEVRLGIAHRGTSFPDVFVDDYEITWDAATGDELLHRELDLARWYEETVPEVRHEVGVEISRWQPQNHLNVFASTPFFPDYGSSKPNERLAWAVSQAHAAGAVVSMNHEFGTGVYAPPGETEAEHRARLDSKRARDVEARVLGVDVLEVGYRWRGGMSLADHLETWDAFTAHGLLLTGTGVNDSHGTDLFYGWRSWLPSFNYENNYVSSLWVRDASASGILDALRAGRVFFADPFLFEGTLDLRVDDTFPMGRAVRSDRDSHLLQVDVTGLSAGSFVRLVQHEIFETPRESAALPTRLRDEILGVRRPDGTFSAQVSLDTSTSSAVRVEIGDGNEAFAFSNPIYFFRHDPPEGIAPSRLAASVGEVLITAADGFRLRNFSWDAVGRVLTLRGDAEGSDATIDLRTSTLGPPTRVTGAEQWSYRAGELRLAVLPTGSVTVTVEWDSSVAGSIRLGPIGPNPFREELNVGITLTAAAHTRVDIIDISGRRVRTLTNGPLDAGTHTLKWNGRDNRGRIAAAGVYFVRVRSGSREDARKIVKLI